jgi:hypothetical protein
MVLRPLGIKADDSARKRDNVKRKEQAMTDVKTEFVCDAVVDLAEPLMVGPTPHGTRIIVYLTGGSVKGPDISGEVLPGGGDWLLMRPDGAGELDVRAAIRTDDGELIYAYYRGILDGPPDLIPKTMEGDEADPSTYYFRTAPVFETASEKYQSLNRGIFVGLGSIHQNQVRYKIYKIL